MSSVRCVCSHRLKDHRWEQDYIEVGKPGDALIGDGPYHIPGVRRAYECLVTGCKCRTAQAVARNVMEAPPDAR